MLAIFEYGAIVQGFWDGFFQLLALGLAAGFATLIYQARKARSQKCDVDREQAWQSRFEQSSRHLADLAATAT